MIEVIIQPEAFYGYKVDHVTMEPGHLESVHPNGEQKILVLAMKHPTQPGNICVAADDVKTAFVPACCWAPQDAELAHKLYAEYNLGGAIERAGLAWNDTQVPTWGQLVEWAAGGDAGRQGVLDKWRAVAKRVRGLVTSRTEHVTRLIVHGEGLAPKLLGSEVWHPTYGGGVVVTAADWAWIEEYPVTDQGLPVVPVTEIEAAAE